MPCISTCNLQTSDNSAGISTTYLISLSLLFSHRAVMRIRAMIIWWWMRLVVSRRPLLASLHCLHLHTSCKHTRQDHLNNDNNNNNPPPIHLCLPLFHIILHKVHVDTHTHTYTLFHSLSVLYVQLCRCDCLCFNECGQKSKANRLHHYSFSSVSPVHKIIVTEAKPTS